MGRWHTVHVSKEVYDILNRMSIEEDKPINKIFKEMVEKAKLEDIFKTIERTAPDGKIGRMRIIVDDDTYNTIKNLRRDVNKIPFDSEKRKRRKVSIREVSDAIVLSSKS